MEARVFKKIWKNLENTSGHEISRFNVFQSTKKELKTLEAIMGKGEKK